LTSYSNPDFTAPPQDLAALLSSAGARSFFAQAAWYGLMARHGVTSGTGIRVVTGGSGSAGAALLLQEERSGERRRLRSLANPYSVEHGPLCTDAAAASGGIAAIIREMLAERPRVVTLALVELDPADPSYAMLVGELGKSGMLVRQLFNSGTWYEDTSGMSFSDYVGQRPSELRNTWLRKRRKMMRTVRLSFDYYRTSAGIDQAVHDYGAVYAASWKPTEARPEFIPALIRLAAECGALRLGVYRIDGEPAAAQMWIVWNGRAVIYKLAHRQSLDPLSLGTLLTMEMMERVLGEDCPSEVNFGRGDDPYKRLWLPRRRERWGIYAANPMTLVGAYRGIRGEAAKLYHRLQGEKVAPGS
jgi:hypothetical protein